MKGKIHSIETCGTLDGPGIRNVIFFYGCPLNCLYCHNIDTHYKNGNFTLYTPYELLEKVKRYKNYFDASGGGVTVSGGEPTFQPEFLGEFLKLLKENKIHTAVDTSGYVDLEKIPLFLPYTDLVILDIKHLDNKECIKLTGKSNERNLKFLNILCEKNIPVLLRQVVVPGFTDSKEYIKRLFDFSKNYKNIIKLELLPFHKMGEYKWEALGLTPPLKQIPELSNEKLLELERVLK